MNIENVASGLLGAMIDATITVVATVMLYLIERNRREISAIRAVAGAYKFVDVIESHRLPDGLPSEDLLSDRNLEFSLRLFGRATEVLRKRGLRESAPTGPRGGGLGERSLDGGVRDKYRTRDG